MKPKPQDRERLAAQELMFDAMDAIGDGHVKRASALCDKALTIHADCVDALVMRAEIKGGPISAYAEAVRAAIEAGRHDLGPRSFKRLRGEFWGFRETRPFMRAMEQLGLALVGGGNPERVVDAIGIFEEMLDLNPNDNQGVRDWLPRAIS